MSTSTTSEMTDITAKEIGERLVKYRLSRSKTQQTMAVMADVSRGYWADIERGRCRPSRAFIEALLKTHDVNIDWLLTGRGPMRWGPSWRPLSDSEIAPLSDSEIASNRISTQESVEESKPCYESDKRGRKRHRYPIPHCTKQAEFLEFMARLTPEQQDHVLEIIKESAQLNELKAKVADLEAKLNVLQTMCPESALPAK